MLPEQIEKYIVEHFANVTTSENYGYKFFFYGDDQRIPFVTLATTDNEHDSISNLNRPGVFRINLGVTKATFSSLFDDTSTTWDFKTLNTIMPHPDYAAQHFVCVLNPEGQILDQTLEMIDEGYNIAKKRFDRINNS